LGEGVLGVQCDLKKRRYFSVLRGGTQGGGTERIKTVCKLGQHEGSNRPRGGSVEIPRRVRVVSFSEDWKGESRRGPQKGRGGTLRKSRSSEWVGDLISPAGFGGGNTHRKKRRRSKSTRMKIADCEEQDKPSEVR